MKFPPLPHRISEFSKTDDDQNAKKHLSENKQDDHADAAGEKTSLNQKFAAEGRGNQYRILNQAVKSEASFIKNSDQKSSTPTNKDRSRFLKANNYTQGHVQGTNTPDAPLSNLIPHDLLVISENKNNLVSDRYELDGVEVTKTFFETDDEEKQKRTSENSEFWDWTRNPLPFKKDRYDFVMARSMICACEDIDHYEKLPGSGDVAAVSTCGGVEKTTQEKVLREVAGLISKNPKAKAYLTLSPRLHYQGIEDRSQQRAKALEFWEDTVERLNNDGGNKFVILPIFITEGNIPVLNVNDDRVAKDGPFEKKGDFFGFKIKHKKMHCDANA